MSRVIGICIYIIGSIATATAQLMLKNAAVKRKHISGIRKLLNIKIILAYGMIFGALAGNMIAMRTMYYKETIIFSAFPYIFVLFIGKFCFKESIDIKKSIGITLIFLGMAVYCIG